MTQASAMLDVDMIICAECSDTTRSPDTCQSCESSPALNGYVLLRRIGHGAVGTTYEAHRLSDGRRFAIKEILVRRFESATGRPKPYGRQHHHRHRRVHGARADVSPCWAWS